MPPLSIKLNTLESTFRCSVCGQEEFANQGPQLFLAESWAPVCRECGDEHAPGLSALLDLAAAATAFHEGLRHPPSRRRS